MTEVGNNLVENGHSPSDNNKMSRSAGGSGGGVNGQEHGFPTPPYNLVPSIREEEEDEELDQEQQHENGLNFKENSSPSNRRPVEDERVDDDDDDNNDDDTGMEVDPMNHQEDEDDEVDRRRPRINEQLHEVDDDENSMDSYDQNGIIAGDDDEDKNGADDEDADHYGKTVRSILNHQKNLSRRISEDEQVTEEDDDLLEDDDIEEDDEGKLIIDAANELHHHQQQQQHQRIMESKLRNSAGATTTTATVNKSSGASSSRPSSTSPNRTSPNANNSAAAAALLNSQYQQQQQQHQASILNMMMTGNKDRLVNGHGQQVLTSSSQMMNSSSGRPFHEPMERQQQHHRHHHHPSRHHHHNHHNHGRNDMIRSSDRKSSRSPLECDVKPEGLVGGLSNSNFNSSIGNALINLASLGSLASIPNLLTPGSAASDSLTRSILSQSSSTSSSSQLQPPLPPPPFSSTMSGGSVNAPLNLTSSSGASSGGNNNNYTSSVNNSQNAFNNTILTSHLAQLISQQQQQQQNNNLMTNNLLNSAALAAAAASAAASTNNNNNSNMTNGSNANSSSSGMPQLILASGQIVQGIQGAQLLIPTSQGLMSQTILTIPLNQPGGVAGMGVGEGGQPLATSSSSPSSSSSSNLYPPSISPQIPSNNHHHHSSSYHHSHLQRQQQQAAAAHAHGATRGHPLSPPVAPTVPPATSPDFSDHHPSALPAPNLNLGPHSLSSQMGAHIPMVQDKLSELHQLHQQQQQQQRQQRHHQSPASMNGNRREMNTITTNGGLSISTLPQPKASPCDSSHDSDAFSDNDDSDQMVDGINLDEIKEFAKAFKLRRLSLGLTQTQVGQALSVTEGPAYSQSAICSALAWQLAQSQTHSNRTSIPQPFMFEKLDITPKSAQKIKPVLERWMKEAEDRYKNGHQNLNDFVGMEPSKKRKRRTSFTPQALEILNTHFERNTHPSGAEITTLAHQLGYEREVIRIWFCNKRQALKNTVRMMSKGSSPL